MTEKTKHRRTRSTDSFSGLTAEEKKNSRKSLKDKFPLMRNLSFTLKRQSYVSPTLPLEKTKVSKWKLDHVNMFFEFLKFEKKTLEKLKKEASKRKVKGLDITKMKTNSFVKLFHTVFDGEKTPHERLKLECCIKKLRKLRKFRPEWFLMFRKLYSQFVSSEEVNTKPFADLIIITNILSDKDLFYRKYFSFYVSFYQYKECCWKLKEVKKKIKRFESIPMPQNKGKKKADVLKSVRKKLEKNREKFRQECYDNYKNETGQDFSEIENKISGVSKKKNWNIPCKIVITELFDEKDTFKQKFRDLVSPIVKILPGKFNSKFGLFHTALIIGSWYLEWNNTEIIIPKEHFQSQKALISHDVPNLYTFESKNFKKLVKIIVEVIWKWNNRYTFAQFRDIQNRKGNCQDFIDDLLKSLNISKDVMFSGMLGNFIKKMKSKGNSEIEFCPGKKFREQFKIKWKRKVFETHESIDKFYQDRRDEYPQFQFDFREEYYLLKSFDRAFWLRHIKNKEDKRYIPLMKKYKTKEVQSCPFGDPRATYSFRPQM